MKTSNLLILCTFICAGATQAAAQDESEYPLNTTIRDYAKRDRLLIGGLDYISPSQLHENEGMRARLEAETQNSELTKQGADSDLITPSVTVGAAYGWQSFTLGVQGTYINAENEGEGPTEVKEEFEGTRIMPEIAYTFGKYFTAGVGVEFTQLDVEETLGVTNEFGYDFPRAIAGLSYHEPAYEIGLAFTSEVQDDDTLSVVRDEPSLSLAATTAPNERAIYLPAMGTAFARGNLTDNFSVLSAVSYARYDGNVDGAVPLFEDYKSADRFAGKLLGTYWTSARSRVSLAAEYKGAATAAINTEENLLGYRLANLYGGTLEGILAINRLAYIGLNASYMRGERGDTEDASGVRYTAKEETQKYAGFVTVKL